MLGVGALLRPKSIPTRRGTQAYECGEDPIGSAWVKFNIRFYVVAIIFIIFDVEVAAVLPVATQFKEAVLNGGAGLVFAELFLFIALLILGLIYCWVRGDLEWVKGVTLNAPKK
ncbi:NADH-quinone oxidoreductase subunit A [bacterium]|nr:NADH-quinone oxidoreductase subunit A [bacterium]